MSARSHGCPIAGIQFEPFVIINTCNWSNYRACNFKSASHFMLVRFWNVQLLPELYSTWSNYYSTNCWLIYKPLLGILKYALAHTQDPEPLGNTWEKIVFNLEWYFKIPQSLLQVIYTHSLLVTSLIHCLIWRIFTPFCHIGHRWIASNPLCPWPHILSQSMCSPLNGLDATWLIAHAGYLQTFQTCGTMLNILKWAWNRTYKKEISRIPTMLL